MKKLNLIMSLFIPILLGCDTPAGRHGISQDIKESKKRNVFIAEYQVYPNPYKINDTLQITVVEAWLEKHWAYGNSETETIFYPTENYQLCINTTKKDIQYMDENWTIGVDGNKYMRSTNEKSLVGDFKLMPNDTIEYKVQKGISLIGDDPEINIIGKLVLIKKK